MIAKNGVLRDSTGIRFEKPRPTNPYKTWDSDRKWGFRGLFITCGEFFYFLYFLKNSLYGYPPGFFFNGPKKSIKTPKTPFGHRLGAATAPAVAADANIYQEQHYAE
jgi:hypothetical protein